MRMINVVFEDKEFKQLETLKGKLTWRRFILRGAHLPYEVKDI